MKSILKRTTSLAIVAGLAAVSWQSSAVGQQAQPPPRPPEMRETRQSFQQRLQEVMAGQLADASPDQAQPLTRFDLDFPGGTPGALAEAIEKASGKPLNLVIPIGAAKTPLPPLKMRGVTVPELFHALQMASQNTRSSSPVLYGRQSSSGANVLFYNFQTADESPGDSSVWYLSTQSQEEPKAVRFWQLAPYLEDYTVDDITTAIQTGYRMLGDSPPKINFHQDTRLLIAVDEQGKLGLIDAVLEQLATPKPLSPAERPRRQSGAPPAPTPVAPRTNP